MPPRPTKQSDLFKIFEFSQASKKKKGESATDVGVDDNEDVNDDDKAYEGDSDKGDNNNNNNNNHDDEEKDSEWEKPEDPPIVAGETRKEHTKRRSTEKDKLKQRSDDLRTKGNNNYTIMVNSRKVTKVNPIPLYQPWTRRSSINSHAPPAGFRGSNLIRHHTWEWCSIMHNSWARAHRILTGAAILEHCYIVNYRCNLLRDTEGGLCFLRNKTEELSEAYRVAVKTGPRQTTLWEKKTGGKVASTSHAIAFEWADKLVAPASTVIEFDLEEEDAKHLREVTQAHQRKELQQAITTLEGMRIFWKDTTGSATKGERPAINPQVHAVLEKLVKVSINPLSSFRP